MKVSRRDFIHAGCAAVLMTMPMASIARPRGVTASPTFLNPLLSQRNVINLWYPDAEWNYGLIDHMILGDNIMTPYGATFNNAWSGGTKTFGQVVDQNGWVNDASGSGQTWGGGVRMPASADFNGPYVIRWNGDGKVQFAAGTWTEEPTSIVRAGNANSTTTLSGFTDVTGLWPGFTVSGVGVSGGTKVVSIDYSAKTIVVSAAVTTGTGVSFTFTNGSYTKNANGQWTNTTGGNGYVVVRNSGITTPPNGLLGIQIATTGLGGAISVSSMSWSGGLVTVTTAAPHGRPNGYTLALTFAGATPSSLNSTVDCTVTGLSTYTFPLAANPGAITGTITYTAFVTNLRIYRLADETDFMPTSVGGNGYVWRRPYKQLWVNMRPAAIRLLNHVNGNDSIVYRFENRSLPTKAGASRNVTAGPAYGPTSGTNQITLSAVSTPTTGNKNLTPGAMTHGEVCYTRLVNATSSGSNTITGITQANPGVVTTSAAHGYANGDKVWFTMPYPANAPASMKELDRVACIVANATATTFELTDLNGVNINTTTFTAFSTTPGTNRVYRYVSLNIGGRGEFPVVQGGSGNGNPSFNAGVNGLTGDTYYTFYFDKNQAGTRTAGAAPGWTQGAWLVRSNAPWGDVPIETCAALVAEVNLLAVSQGVSQPIHLWLTFPATGLLDCDPDYTAQSDYPLNAINAAMSGGYGCIGLSATAASIVVEWSNELWNFGTFVANYTNWLGYLRGTLNTANFESIQALRSTRMSRSIKASSPWASRVYTTLGLQGIRGWDSQNRYTALGDLVSSSNIIFTDPWNNWGSATPLSFHDAVNPATYLQPTQTYSDTVSGTGTLADDSALFNGTDNSAVVNATFTNGVNSIAGTNTFTAGNRVIFQTTVGNFIAGTPYTVSSTGLSSSAFQLTAVGSSTIITPSASGSASTVAGGNYSGAANPTQAIANFITSINTTGTGGQQTINNYCSQASPGTGILAAINTGVVANGNKRIIQYEGGTDWACNTGGFVNAKVLSANDALFMNAINQSQQWATAQAQFFDNIKTLSNHGPGALYLYLKLTSDLRWGYAQPDVYKLGVEGDNLTTQPMWTTMATRNAALSV